VQELPSLTARQKECLSEGSGLITKDSVDETLTFGAPADRQPESPAPSGSARLGAADGVDIAAPRDIETWLRHVEMRVRQLNSSGSNQLTLVIQPDSPSEILLEFRLRDGQVEAHARCEKETFAQLNMEWGQLQQALSASGVRLSALMALPDRSVGSSDPGSGLFHAATSSDQQGYSSPERDDARLKETQQTTSFRPRCRVFPLGSTRLLERWA
jgi:hypothetical protein